MTEWAFILTPLLVLFAILLFRYVGCGLDAVGQLVMPNYPDYILGKPTHMPAMPHFDRDVKPNGHDGTP